MRRLFVTLLLLLVFPGSAAAGTFDVYTVGCSSGWKAQTFAPEKLQQEDQCSSWRIWSSAPLEQGDFAAMSMYAGEGAQFTGFSVRSAGFARSGTAWTMGMCKEPFGHCTNHVDRTGEMPELETALGTTYPGGGPLYSTHVYAGVRCIQATCPDSRATDVTHTSAHVIVDDFTAPGAPTLSGISTGWNNGTKELGYTASDAGSGIASAELFVDGEPVPTTSVEHSCLRLPGGAYSHPIPCATATGGQFALNTRELTDGRHSVTVAVNDAGGSTGSSSKEFLVDNTPPDPLDAVTVDGGDGWRRNNAFAISWDSPAADEGSAIAGVYYKVGAAPTGATDGTFVGGGEITSLSAIPVPADGEWPVYVWLQDEAGNAAAPSEPVAHLRLDTSAPSVAFANARDANNPAEVRVETADAMSGVAGGRIDIRRKGGTDWRALATRLDGSQLVAVVPDDQLARGTYELQASAWDAAGNGATTTARADGQPMALDLPLRAPTRLSATLSSRAGGAGRASRSIRIGYGGNAWLRGSLRSAARRLGRARLLVIAKPLAGALRWRTTVVTDARGRYAVRLPRGGSRDITVRFPGNARLRPAEKRAWLLVRGWASLELRPATLRRGGTIAFVGRVGRLGAKLPPAGKLIQIQFLDGSRWRPAVKLGHTRPSGRFTIRYRFRRISRPTRIYFRILVPAEGGWPYATGWSPVRVAFVRP